MLNLSYGAVVVKSNFIAATNEIEAICVASKVSLKESIRFVSLVITHDSEIFLSITERQWSEVTSV